MHILIDDGKTLSKRKIEGGLIVGGRKDPIALALAGLSKFDVVSKKDLPIPGVLGLLGRREEFYGARAVFGDGSVVDMIVDDEACKALKDVLRNDRAAQPVGRVARRSGYVRLPRMRFGQGNLSEGATMFAMGFVICAIGNFGPVFLQGMMGDGVGKDGVVSAISAPIDQLMGIMTGPVAKVIGCMSIAMGAVRMTMRF